MKSCVLCALMSFIGTSVLAGPDDPFADFVVAFDQGTGGTKGYDSPSTTLGSPERFTGEGIFPSVVSEFNPAFGLDELVSIGRGGFLTVGFNTPITDDPANPWGIDLLIFGNTGFIDGDYPNGIVDGIFGADGGLIEVSADGRTWFEISGITADNIFPTIGYLDSGPYDDEPGRVESDFTLPVNPNLSFDDFAGLDHAGVLGLYNGSGGGVGVDIASSGLDAISFVRISYTGDLNVEIEAFADVAPVPGPGALWALAIGACGCARRRRSP